MRCLLSTLALGLLFTSFTGCQSPSPTMTNPFLAPDRVPPPATRALMPGTAQPYYGTAPVPNTPVIGAPPAGVQTTPVQTAPSTFAPQPAGTIPPGGWNSTPQAFPGGATSHNFAPSNLQQASANLPTTPQSAVQIQPDQQSLRFEGSSSNFPPATFAATTIPSLPPDPSILPTPEQQPFIPQGVQPAGFQTPLAQQPILQQPVPAADPREVRIRAISSDQLDANGQSRTRDGFRPQGSSQVRKPTLPDRIVPPADEQPVAENRFGFAPQYDQLRGQLHYAADTGQWSILYSASQSNSDRFGGNLTIANPQVLGNLQPGDFVRLRGRVAQLRGTGAAVIPVYQVSVVQRQRI